MGKILTVAICAYNMEKYIAEALESCIIKDRDQLEVLIMNDGSTDRTREICEQYCRKYPDVFILINKENAGWGSNVNLAIKMSRGRYFRILDADDWFDTEELQKFVTILYGMEESLVISRYKENVEGKRKKIRLAGKNYENGISCCMNQLKDEITFGIWEVTFLTSLVKEHHIELPENVLYMDTLYIMQLLPYVYQIYFTDLYVYNYRLNRKGQSNDIQSLIRHYKELLLTFEKQFEFYKKVRVKNNNLQMFYRLAATYSNVVEKLVKISDDKEKHVDQLIKEYDDKLKAELPELYQYTGKRKVVKAVRLVRYHFCPLIKRLFELYHIRD